MHQYIQFSLKTKDIFNTFLNAVDHNMTEVHL